MSTKLITRNPYNGEELASYDLWDSKKIQAGLKLSAKAYSSWSQTELWYRVDLLKKLSNVLELRVDECAEMISLEMGKTFREAKAEVLKCADASRYIAENAEAWLRPVEIERGNKEAKVFFQSTGAVFAIMPWNFPFWQVIRQASTALAGGNVMILKHASNVTGCSILLEKLFLEAGFPKGVFQSFIIKSDLAEEVIASEIVSGVAFTGSEGGGRSVASIAGKYGKKVVLELGGSDPFIVFEDVKIETVVKEAVMARYQNAGQSCIAAKRFIVQDSIYNDFVKAFVKEIESLKLGDPMSEDTQMGVLADERFAKEVEQQVKASIELGAKLHGTLKRKGASVAPVLVSNVKDSMPVWKEETFGPVAVVVSFKDIDEAVKKANNTRFGLGAVVFSDDISKAEKVAVRLESGQVFINSMVKSDAAFPFGGIKASGIGREMSDWGMKEFLNIKPIVFSKN